MKHEALKDGMTVEKDIFSRNNEPENLLKLYLPSLNKQLFIYACMHACKKILVKKALYFFSFLKNWHPEIFLGKKKTEQR